MIKTYPFFRDLYGSLRGYQRTTIRRAVRQTLHVSPSTIQQRAQELLAQRIENAQRDFPRYAELLMQSHGQPPVLTKHDIQYILANHTPPSDASPHATGGSTGQPLRFYITRESYEWRTAVSDRGYSYAQAEEGQRSFYVWGAPISKPSCRQQIKASLHHRLQNRMYFNSFQFDEAQMTRCCAQINRFKPVSLVGYAGNLVALAQFVARHPHLLTWRARTAVTAAEGLPPGMRQIIEQHLAQEVFMSYGSREFMLIGMETHEHDGYQIAADNVYVEVVDAEGTPCPPGVAGDIVVTDLHNMATPFIRYKIGDVGVMAPADDQRLPTLARVDGRNQEVIVRADGSRITALFFPHLMKDFPRVGGYQVEQQEPGIICLHLITSDPNWRTWEVDIRAAIARHVGEGIVCTCKRVETLQKTASGKTPIVVERAGRL